MPRIRANGIDIAFESFGRERDPTVLLIHGLATPLTGWPDSLCDGLVRRGFRVVRFDNRDIGQSTFFTELGIPDIGALMATVQSGARPVPPYPLDAMAADAVGLLDALGDRSSPRRRRLDGRHDRAARRARSSRADGEPRLDHVLDRPARPPARQA